MIRSIEELPPAVDFEQPIEDVGTEGGRLRYENAHLRNSERQAHHELDMLSGDLGVDLPRRLTDNGHDLTPYGRIRMLRDSLRAGGGR